ncbi:MAG TPA: hypothetical protein VFG73_11835 [Rhodanobacteraceae bacterium]|nr:hypothetical protein [Rhodanobacteraceae bacterium]
MSRLWLRRMLSAGVALLLPAAASAQNLALHAYADARWVAAPAQRSWLHGGFGKTRYGAGDDGWHFGGGGVAAAWQATPSLLALAEVQVEPGGDVEVLEAWLRYRPVSITRWRWSVLAGTFFPPVSLENDAVGWTSSWTLTPSAINSWIGEELRSTGAEAQVEWRGVLQTFALRASVFEGNDPTGNLLAVRGWSLSDRSFGLGGRVPDPDVVTVAHGGHPPGRYDPFESIGACCGWYADLEWHPRGRGELRLMRYDNRADPSIFTRADHMPMYAWHTWFWSLGGKLRQGPLTWIAQAMDGDTVVAFRPDRPRVTGFRSAFVMAAWNRGHWRPALRIEHFSTSDPAAADGSAQGEHGNAVTFALNWRPRDWLRITGEVLRIDSTRSEAVMAVRPLHVHATQVQVGLRLMY